MKGNVFVALITWQAGLISSSVTQAGGHNHTYIQVFQVMDVTNDTRSDFIICDCDSGEQDNGEMCLVRIHVF